MIKPEILIIDDEPQIRKLLEINLESNNYKVWQAGTGQEGIRLAAAHTPDLIILDLGLPDKSGHEVLTELRQWYNHAIIILSVRNSETDIVTALDNGATDYLAKPFNTAELMARIRSGIRRNQVLDSTCIFETGSLQIDLVSRTVRKNGVIIKLTLTEFKLLALFVKNQGRVLTHQYILKEVWGVGSQTETQYLRVFVGSLRKKIEDNPDRPFYITTESRIGYRFS